MAQSVFTLPLKSHTSTLLLTRSQPLTWSVSGLKDKVCEDLTTRGDWERMRQAGAWASPGRDEG